MKFKEVLGRLTGFSVPIFGVSWNPPAAEVTVARTVITFLEDRRALFSPYEIEDPEYCIESVIEIRQFLTGKLTGLTKPDGLAASLRAMRAACRKFLDSQSKHPPRRRKPGYADYFKFVTDLGELRGVFGIHVAALAAQHGLDVEGELASILPAKPTAKDGRK